MGLSVCPSSVVDAPIDAVWRLLTRPESFDTWVDAKLIAAEPAGDAQPGQRLRLVTKEIGLTFAISMEVLEVDAEQHRLHLMIALPFGVVNDETITMADAGNGRTLVRFG